MKLYVYTYFALMKISSQEQVTYKYVSHKCLKIVLLYSEVSPLSSEIVILSYSLETNTSGQGESQASTNILMIPKA